MRAPITIVVTVYLPPGSVGESRFKSAELTLDSWAEHLRYDGLSRILIVSSTGPLDQSEWMALVDRVPNAAIYSIHHRGGVGGSLNMGFEWARDRASPLVFYAADDWALDADFDLTPWADLLIGDPSVGAVRLGPPHPHLTGCVQMWPQGWAFRLDRHHYAFGHRPALYHQRMIDAYGPFDERANAWECERLYNEHFCRTPGPDVVYALPYPWRHVGETEVGDVEPQGAINGPAS